MFKSNKLIVAMVIVFFAIVAFNPTLGFSAGDVNPDAAAGKGGGKPKAQKYLGLPKTGQTISYATGDDGDLQKGVAWPDPRFTDNNDGTVKDNLTGLVWMKNANCFGVPLPWEDALGAAATLQDGTFGLTDGSKASDWRLPNIRELLSLVDYGRNSPPLPEGHPFTNVQLAWSLYASSTSVVDLLSDAWTMHFYQGETFQVGKSAVAFYVWCVRDIRPAGKSSGKAQKYLGLPKTGQTISYATGDDGDLQKGVAWPDPRFTDNNDGTVKDNLTGLVWMKNVSALGTMPWADAFIAAATLADGNYDLTDGSKAGDWRLPNMRELQSLIDYGRFPCLPEGPFTPFPYVMYYWSSTSVDGGSGWYVYFTGGRLNSRPGYESLGVWCVRDALK